MTMRKKAQEYLVLWESGDEKIRDNWKTFLSWVFDGYKKHLKILKCLSLIKTIMRV